MNGGGIPPRPTTIDITSAFDSSGWESRSYIAGRSNKDHVLGEVYAAPLETIESSGFVNIETYSKLTMTVLQQSNSSSYAGACFYDASQNAIQGIFYGADSPSGMIEKEITIPPGASYIRTTRRIGGSYGPFSCIAE